MNINEKASKLPKSAILFECLLRFLLSKEPDVMIVYQCTKSTFLPEFGIFKIEAIAGKFSIVKIEELALFSPLNLYTVNYLSLDRFTAVSLNKKPIIFA